MAHRALMMAMMTMGVLWSLLAGPARAESYGVGSISGAISSADKAVPALRIYAISTDGKIRRMITTPPDETRFAIGDVPAGQYHVVGYPHARDGGISGAVAWTRAARCVKGPCDHSLIVVKVVASQESNGVLLADWYVPPALLPADPAAAVSEKAAPGPDCERERDQAGRDTCHLRAQEAAEKGLNRHYERIMRALEKYPRCHEDLRNAQFAWIRFRDQHCAYEGALGQKGRTVRCLRELTESRARYLADQSPLVCNANR